MTNEDVNGTSIRGFTQSPLMIALADNRPQQPGSLGGHPGGEQQLLGGLACAGSGGRWVLCQVGQREDVDGLIHVNAVGPIGERCGCGRGGGRRVGGVLERYREGGSLLTTRGLWQLSW